MFTLPLRRQVLLIGNVAGKFTDGVSNLCETFRVKGAALSISLRQLQTLQGDLIIVRSQRPFFQELFGLFGSFRRVTSKHPLVKDFGGRKSWSVPKHDVKEFQAFHMTPKHNKAYRQRRSEDEPNGTPKRGPKRRRRNHSNGRKPCA